jgi:hypothetical protein
MKNPSQKNLPRLPLAALRGDLEIKYNRSRLMLLLIVIFTGINLFMATFLDAYFMFSATVPMMFPVIGANLAVNMENDLYLYVMLGIGVLLVVPYLLAWIFSKKRVGWMIAALAFFSLDSLLLLLSFDPTMFPDIFFHGVGMYFLITGVIQGLKLKDLPTEDPLADPADSPAENPFDAVNRTEFNYDVKAAETDKGAEHVATSDKK